MEKSWRSEWNERAKRDCRFFVASDYAASDEKWVFGAKHDAEFILHHLPKDLGPNHTILDLGCGPGRLLPFFAQRFSLVVGCDVSDEMLKHAKYLCKDLSNVSLFLSDGTSLNFQPNHSINVVIALAVFIHLDKKTIQSYLSEINRILVDGGYFAFDCRSARTTKEDGVQKCWFGHKFTMDELVATLKSCGFEIVLSDHITTGENWPCWNALCEKVIIH